MATPTPTSSLGTPNPAPVQVNNQDVCGLYDRIQRFMSELWKSSSSDGTQFLQADLDRLNSYLAALVAYTSWVTAQPQMDFPQTHPRAYILDPVFVPTDATGAPDTSSNFEINDVIRMMGTARDELVSSASARLGAGLETYDATRWNSYIAKIQAFVTNYIAKVTPVDTPANSGNPLTEPATNVGQQTR